MRNELFRASLAVLGLALAAGATAADVRFASTVQPIFDANCVSCHQSGAAQQGLNLESGSSYAAIVNHRSTVVDRALVVPGSPGGSYLLLKVLGTQGEVGGKGVRMPMGGDLTAADIQSLRDWIAAGAKND
jgi:mono/diheme cytochrome c family protein